MVKFLKKRFSKANVGRVCLGKDAELEGHERPANNKKNECFISHLS